MFIIEDQIHAESIGRYSTREEAIAELRRLAAISWDEAPNKAPCQSWKTCGRDYEIIEYDDSATPWKELSRQGGFELNSKMINWKIK